MTFDPIKRLEIENYGCIRSASFDLNPLHALIGPNDSGKSTTLRALQYACESAFDAGHRELGNGVVRLLFSDSFGIEISSQGHSPIAPVAVQIASRIAQATLLRFTPNALRASSPPIPDCQTLCFANEQGSGLAGVLDAICKRNPQGFLQIQSKLSRFFPNISKLSLVDTQDGTKAIALSQADGSQISRENAGDGLLYFLGFLALQYTEQPRIFLVEAPENGLHPARIAEVMSVLREISKTSQVIVATHSPLVVNELQGHEISIVTRDLVEGTRSILLKDVPRFDLSMKVYQPGEFWLCYSDGNLEEPLLTGKPRT